MMEFEGRRSHGVATSLAMPASRVDQLCLPGSSLFLLVAVCLRVPATPTELDQGNRSHRARWRPGRVVRTEWRAREAEPPPIERSHYFVHRLLGAELAAATLASLRLRGTWHGLSRTAQRPMWLALETVEAATEIESLARDRDDHRERLAARRAHLHGSNVSSIRKPCQ